MKTQFKIVARGINCTYGTTWMDDVKSTKLAIHWLKYKYATDYQYKKRFENLRYLWLELYQSAKKEKELDNWPGGKLIATMGCKYGK